MAAFSGQYAGAPPRPGRGLPRILLGVTDTQPPFALLAAAQVRDAVASIRDAHGSDLVEWIGDPDPEARCAIDIGLTMVGHGYFSFEAPVVEIEGAGYSVSCASAEASRALLVALFGES